MLKCRLCYWIVFTIISSIYVLFNWNDVTNFTFFTSFNGKNLFFLFWLVWLFIPLITSFKLSGLEFGLLTQTQKEDEAQKLDEEYNKNVENIERNQKLHGQERR